MGESEHGVQILGGPAADPATSLATPGAIGPTPAADRPAGAAPAVVNPAALTVAQAARLLGVAEQTIRDHVAGGLPTHAGETINVVQYAAWLNREMKDRDAD